MIFAPHVDPFLDTTAPVPANPLDTVDPAWGLGSAHRDFPPRVEVRRVRLSQPDPCSTCDGREVVENDDTDSVLTPMWRACPDCAGAA